MKYGDTKLRVMLDTNILVSAIFFPSIQTRTLITEIICNHNLVLYDYVLEELRLVVERKFPAKSIALEHFFSALRFEMIYTSSDMHYTGIPSVRDNKDTPILATAILHDIDVFITGDKDFLVLDINKPQIMNMAEFLVNYT